jgi:hypothetical protein
MHDDASPQLVAHVERLDPLAVCELVNALACAAYRDAEALDELAARAEVVPVRQQTSVGCPCSTRPVEPFTEHEWVDQNTLGRQVVAADVDFDARMASRPVPDPRRDLLHDHKVLSAGEPEPLGILDGVLARRWIQHQLDDLFHPRIVRGTHEGDCCLDVVVGAP